MKIKLNITDIAKSAGKFLLKMRGFVAVLAFIGLLGFGAYLISKIINLQPDQIYLTTQRQALDQTKISFDKQTVKTINSLQQINPTVNTSNLGKSDPFSPN